MKILVLSDLHNELNTFEPTAVDADVIVLAGDIDNGAKGMVWARKVWPDRQIVYVIGNHEFYGREFHETLALLRRTANARNIHLLENEATIINGVRFLGATLWTDFNYLGQEKLPEAMDEALRRLSDFRMIQFGRFKRFLPIHARRLHQDSAGWLMSELDKPFIGPTVLVTHHLPSQSVPERFVDSPLSAAFASNLDHLFGKMTLWIHGHTHDSCDYLVSGTRVVCNPRGYVTSNGPENDAFDQGKVVEIQNQVIATSS